MIDCQYCIHEMACNKTPLTKEADKKAILSYENRKAFGLESKCPNFYEKRRTHE